MSIVLAFVCAIAVASLLARIAERSGIDEMISDLNRGLVNMQAGDER